VERALPISLAAVTLWLLVTLPMSLHRLRSPRVKAAWTVAVLAVPGLVWLARSQLAAAGLALTEARITQQLTALTPGPAVTSFDRAVLDEGIIAFAAISAPSGLAQQIVFEWRHGGERERIVATIEGGRQTGFRTYTRKRLFPADAAGKWTVDVLTPQGQLVERLTFEVRAE
jgi:hypothetical protein